MRIHDRRTGMLLMLLAGCGGPSPALPGSPRALSTEERRLERLAAGGFRGGGRCSREPAGLPGPQRLDSNGAGFQVEWITASPPLNEQFTVRLRLLDPSGEPLDPVLEGLTVDADMPAHGHGMNVAPALSLEDGWLVAVRCCSTCRAHGSMRIAPRAP